MSYDYPDVVELPALEGGTFVSLEQYNSLLEEYNDLKQAALSLRGTSYAINDVINAVSEIESAISCIDTYALQDIANGVEDLS